VFDRTFTTNGDGMRDRPYPHKKPPNTYRIAVLGSSIDMGWGVSIEETYIKLLENWLNAHAAKRGLSRRFEVLNFAAAAYSPMQRLESYRRKAAAFEPDLVLYSATMLDLRFIEIHVCDLFECHIDLRYDFLRKAVVDAGLTADDLRLNADERLKKKDVVKAKLKTQCWPIYDGTLRTLAEQCHSQGILLACAIVPRVGKIDAPKERAEMVEHLRSIILQRADVLFDLSTTFDEIDPDKVHVAPEDDHPNPLGHWRLFKKLAYVLVDNRPLYVTLFPEPGATRSPEGEVRPYRAPEATGQP
jgi:hypothetical protein